MRKIKDTRSKQKSIPSHKLITYFDNYDKKFYDFNVDNLLQQFTRDDYDNPHTKRRFSSEFIKDISKLRLQETSGNLQSSSTSRLDAPRISTQRTRRSLAPDLISEALKSLKMSDDDTHSPKIDEDEDNTENKEENENDEDIEIIVDDDSIATASATSSKKDSKLNVFSSEGGDIKCQKCMKKCDDCFKTKVKGTSGEYITVYFCSLKCFENFEIN